MTSYCCWELIRRLLNDNSTQRHHCRWFFRCSLWAYWSHWFIAQSNRSAHYALCTWNILRHYAKKTHTHTATKLARNVHAANNKFISATTADDQRAHWKFAERVCMLMFLRMPCRPTGLYVYRCHWDTLGENEVGRANCRTGAIACWNRRLVSDTYLLWRWPVIDRWTFL